jgi:hypothetical protein
MLPDAELQSLANDIRDNGLETPIVTLEGAILDGRNRHRACEIAGVSPRFEEYTGKDPMQFVISHNLHRRHLTESQRGMVAAKLATMKNGGDRKSDGISASIDAVTKAEACEALKVGVSTLDRARKIQRIGAPELVAAVEAGEVTVGAAYKVAELDHDEQKKILEGGATGVKEAAKKLRQRKTKTPSMVANGDLSQNTTCANQGKYTPSDGMAIWATAKSILNRIHANDTELKTALEAAKQYIETRLENDQ